jgi:hypothetical protein
MIYMIRNQATRQVGNVDQIPSRRIILGLMFALTDFAAGS